MTQADAIAELKEIERKYYADPYEEHHRTDKLVLRILSALGYSMLAQEIERLREGWWYS